MHRFANEGCGADMTISVMIQSRAFVISCKPSAKLQLVACSCFVCGYMSTPKYQGEMFLVWTRWLQGPKAAREIVTEHLFGGGRLFPQGASISVVPTLGPKVCKWDHLVCYLESQGRVPMIRKWCSKESQTTWSQGSACGR